MPFRARLLAVAALAVLALSANAAPSMADDYAGDAYNVLPPGQAGGIFITRAQPISDPSTTG